MTIKFASLILAGLGLGSGALGSVTFRQEESSWTNDSLTSVFAQQAKALFLPRTVISFQGQEWFENVTERWDIYAPPTFKVSVSPSTEKDVESAVKLAAKFKIPFLATGGRHGYGTTLGKLKNGLSIDLSLLNQFSIDSKAATITVGPGVRFRDIFTPLYEAGFQVPTGTCSCVGMIGATLGGGIGRLNGLDGLMIDALESARVVTADGRTLTVSEKENKDLFWGMRGAGQNFGVVVSATYKLKPLYAAGVWTNVDLIFSPDKNATYFDVVTSMEVPPQLTIASVVTYNATLDEPQLIATLTWTGPREEALAAMKPILDVGPRHSEVTEATYATLPRVATFGTTDAVCAPGQIYDIYGVGLRRLDSAAWRSTFSKMARFYAAEPAGRASSILYETWPVQATVAVPDDATAYPWRDASTYVLIQMRWDRPGSPVERAADRLGAELRRDLSATGGYQGAGPAVYVNYAHGDERLEDIYGARKLPRLARLKKQYDPANVFRFHHALPTKYP
ncbi:oxidation resistance protein 1 [Pyricularia oryzae]|nr:oxidation resistance protein 1 [Pyricularia oryzae]